MEWVKEDATRPWPVDDLDVLLDLGHVVLGAQQGQVVAELLDALAEASLLLPLVGLVAAGDLAAAAAGDALRPGDVRVKVGDARLVDCVFQEVLRQDDLECIMRSDCTLKSEQWIFSLNSVNCSAAQRANSLTHMLTFHLKHKCEIASKFMLTRQLPHIAPSHFGAAENVKKNPHCSTCWSGGGRTLPCSPWRCQPPPRSLPPWRRRADCPPPARSRSCLQRRKNN